MHVVMRTAWIAVTDKVSIAIDRLTRTGVAESKNTEK
jgi:hypothetical protein